VKSGNGSGGGRGAWIIGVVVVMAVVRLISGLSSSRPPDPPRFDLTKMPQLVFPPQPLPPEFDKELIRRGLLGQRLRQPGEQGTLRVNLDVAHLPSFCAVLQLQGEHAVLTPGRRLWDMLDADTRELMTMTAAKLDQVPSAEVRDTILEDLNAALDDVDFYDKNYFVGIPLPIALSDLVASWTQPGTERTVPEARRLHRQLLQAAFPAQIIEPDILALVGEERPERIVNARRDVAARRAELNAARP
jgi:hypothetical protein